LCLNHPYWKFRQIFKTQAIFKASSLSDRFTLIYNRNLWGSKESVSGSGSTFAMTESIRNLLPALFEEFQICSVLDAPCGDFNWMKLVNLNGLTYIGSDIVDSLISDLNNQYASEHISFITIDITRDTLPKSDLVLNRDCLFHLSYQDIKLFLRSFLNSDCRYLLTTSHDNLNEFTNSDIRSGDFRLIDLFKSPFYFPTNFHFEIPEPGQRSFPPRKLYLWDRESVRVAYLNLENFLIEPRRRQ
jgi:hypothetical protein